MRLNDTEKSIRRDIESWQHADSSVVTQAMNWMMRPIDWTVDRVAPPAAVDRVSERIEQFRRAWKARSAGQEQ